MIIRAVGGCGDGGDIEDEDAAGHVKEEEDKGEPLLRGDSLSQFAVRVDVNANGLEAVAVKRQRIRRCIFLQ